VISGETINSYHMYESRYLLLGYRRCRQ